MPNLETVLVPALDLWPDLLLLAKQLDSLLPFGRVGVRSILLLYSDPLPGGILVVPLADCVLEGGPVLERWNVERLGIEDLEVGGREVAVIGLQDRAEERSVRDEPIGSARTRYTIVWAYVVEVVVDIIAGEHLDRRWWDDVMGNVLGGHATKVEPLWWRGLHRFREAVLLGTCS